MRSWLYSDYLTTPTDAVDPSDRAGSSWSSEVRDLLGEIQTIEALDVMCTVAREPARRWRLSELPGSDGMALADSVRHLVARGLLTAHDDGTFQLAHGPRHPTMVALGKLCEDDRPNVLGAIAQLSIDRIRSSAARNLVRRAQVDSENDER